MLVEVEEEVLPLLIIQTIEEALQVLELLLEQVLLELVKVEEEFQEHNLLNKEMMEDLEVQHLTYILLVEEVVQVKLDFKEVLVQLLDHIKLG